MHSTTIAQSPSIGIPTPERSESPDNGADSHSRSKESTEKTSTICAEAPDMQEVDKRVVMARIRDLYNDAPDFVATLGLRRAAPGSYLALNALIERFLCEKAGDLDMKSKQMMHKAATRALSTALLNKFGKDLPHVHLARGTCPYTQLKESSGFAIESDEFHARPLKLEAGEAREVRVIRRDRRVKDGDLAVRPAAEQGSRVTQKDTAEDIASESGGTSKYLSELLTLDCGPELLRLRLYPDAKELTESFAAFHAVRKHLGSIFKPEDSTVTLICVGDGSVPRTATLFAFRTKWKCFSVDPQMRNPGECWGGVKRLEALNAKIEDCSFSGQKMVVVCVHAHVGLAECLAVSDYSEALGIVAMPCCNFYSRLQLSDQQSPVAEYYDSGVVSPHRLVRVYLLQK